MMTHNTAIRLEDLHLGPHWRFIKRANHIRRYAGPRRFIRRRAVKSIVSARLYAAWGR